MRSRRNTRSARRSAEYHSGGWDEEAASVSQCALLRLAVASWQTRRRQGPPCARPTMSSTEASTRVQRSPSSSVYLSCSDSLSAMAKLRRTSAVTAASCSAGLEADEGSSRVRRRVSSPSVAFTICLATGGAAASLVSMAPSMGRSSPRCTPRLGGLCTAAEKCCDELCDDLPELLEPLSA